MEVDLQYERRHMQPEITLTERDQEVFTHSLTGRSAHGCYGCIVTHRVPAVAMTLKEDTC